MVQVKSLVSQWKPKQDNLFLGKLFLCSLLLLRRLVALLFFLLKKIYD